jgi:hypothetical protein
LKDEIERAAVKPPAQPTLVRTQHLPLAGLSPLGAILNQARAAGARRCRRRRRGHLLPALPGSTSQLSAAADTLATPGSSHYRHFS